jgi:NarL family two-component system response regulator LiaR
VDAKKQAPASAGRRNLRVIVADDDPSARRAMRDALQRAGMTVVCEAEDGRQALDLVLKHRPDAVLMDVVMPGLDGLAATRQIINETPDQVVILVSRSEDEAIGLASLRAGAAGCVSSALGVDALPRTVAGAVDGEAAISRRLVMRLVERLRGAAGRTSQPGRSRVTPREWDVIELLAERQSTRQIAESLQLSTETVRSHIKHILRKLDARSREEAVAAAQRLRDAGS